MRILLLRLLLGWWLVIFAWTGLWLLAWLLTGSSKEADLCAIDVSRLAWNGEVR